MDTMDYSTQDRHTIPTLRWTTVPPDSSSAEFFRTSVDYLCQVLSHFRISAIELLALKSRSNENPRPVLVITLHPAESHREDELVTFAAQRRFTELVAVREVIIGIGLVERQRRKIRNGDSISAYTDHLSQGSLGGVISVGNKFYGTTCYHVVHPTKDAATEPEQLLLSSPSQRTIIESRLEAASALNEARSDLLNVQRQITEGSRQPDEATNFELEVSFCERRVQEALEETEIGTVSLSRNQITTRDWNGRNTSVDWTIFTIPSSRHVTIPNKIDLSGIGSPYPSGICRVLKIYDGSTIHTAGSGIVEPKVVYKDGVSSGATKGIIGHGLARVNFDGMGKFTDELFIISDRPFKAFSENGDSGSWLVGEDNDLYGFIIGGLVDRKNLAYRTYFTDIRLLWAEIQELTGEIPQLPQL
ncbi:hypothetical protein L211DRAFT_853490 [Terfezia boudieri ATCC MYA-4762]|uniref:Uncharacterized protein n=1 Tax=Terfezia boudieri ATCC MYA-4762 TaxID=1051890 RepID=A0A3N4L857_9PEZI|nr:hypothetical protein L211DRAFT_853490 [Terfezia boudieri ATCC MYA-4762]